MTDKRIMTQHEKELLQAFKRECALASQTSYNHHKYGKLMLPNKNSVNVMGNIYKLEAEYYASIHNGKKIESFSYLKQIKDRQNHILNELLFESEDGMFTSVCYKTGKLVKGHTEAVRQAGIVFKKNMSQLKCCMETALMLDNEVGYWK